MCAKNAVRVFSFRKHEDLALHVSFYNEPQRTFCSVYACAVSVKDQQNVPAEAADKFQVSRGEGCPEGGHSINESVLMAHYGVKIPLNHNGVIFAPYFFLGTLESI